MFYLVMSGLKAQYRNTILGYLWWILDPLLMGAVYYFLRVVVLGMEGENIGAFLIIGLLTWKWIAAATTNATKAIVSRAGIISQVYLPKAIFPLGSTITQLINFTIGLSVVALFLAFYRIVPGPEALWLPFIMVIQIIFLSAISLVMAYYSVFVRDIDNVLSHVMRLWFYSSPVIWEMGRLPERYNWILQVNPASAFLMGYRNILMYGTLPDFRMLYIIGFISLLVIVYMLYFYSLNEHKIIKVL